jgi:hypothetical protein
MVMDDFKTRGMNPDEIVKTQEQREKEQQQAQQAQQQQQQQEVAGQMALENNKQEGGS